MGLEKVSVIVVVVVGYLSLVRLRRWQRYNAIHKQFGSAARSLSPADAQLITHTSLFYDMPLLMNYALAFALFKTYAIPSISKILLGTKELSSKEGISRRYADTEILISTWALCPINKATDPRAHIAIARVNWLHAHYNIPNDDFLYTLGLFILEPIEWARMYGWRSMSPLEQQAFFVYWEHIGQKMGITDIPPGLDELRLWVANYEREHMIPADSNRLVANYTTDELIHVVPSSFGLKTFARNLSICALEDRVRLAMLQPSQPAYMHAIFKGILHSVSFVQRYFCLPRSKPRGIVSLEMPEESARGRMHPNWFQPLPWYRPLPTSPLSLLWDRFLVLVGKHVTMPSKELKTHGYRLEEVGPVKWEGAGHEETFKMAEQMHGCPIGGVWAPGAGNQ